MEKYVSVEDVMSFINTSNRGSEDYFIVDQIEDLCKHKAKTLEELNTEQRVQDELKNEKKFEEVCDIVKQKVEHERMLYRCNQKEQESYEEEREL